MRKGDISMLKIVVKKLDNVLFGKKLQKYYGKLLATKSQRLLESGLDYQIICSYQKNLNCELSRLCDLWGSDKGEIRSGGHPYPWPSHTYADYYTRLFAHCRNSVTKVFECGLGTNDPLLPSSMLVSGRPGASMRVWRDFFPNAIIFGADIDKTILFEEERIRTYFIDQLDPIAISTYWAKIKVDDFDFMVDDGLHTFEAGSTLFLHSIDKLADFGIYIIEDVVATDLLKFRDFFRDKEYVVDFVNLNRPSTDLDGNNLIVVRRNL